MTTRTTRTTSQSEDLSIAEEVFRRITDDLAMIADRPFALEQVQVRRSAEKAVGHDSIHLSFRLGFHQDGGARQGCLLLPLPAAITLAGYLRQLADAVVAARRADQTLDRSSKEAMLEVGGFVAGAVDAALHKQLGSAISVRFEGCQGVAAGLKPVFEHAPGSELCVAEARARLHDFPGFQAILMMPVLGHAA